ncbi:RNA polymerase sigma factor for flagellar operon FliA [Litorivivens lipolytica]|uniref:RNA polymerase sigma factor for flagellar operon FliA n=1 Tax=Litorivivens lipolytica TaxID=1524264 RepID=A0A7W4W2Y4_9GAMM|nr:RNA polymerase sigma factor FliA [Litorivivens lipolytica]MBB3046350.1 RNA polymerase sigma factor for flagellar operon FliA [Litorivivens lipolytica]
MATGYAAYSEVQQGDRNALVLQHADLVKKIAYHLVARLPDSVDVDDLIQAGMIGMLEAASHFRADGGASFETFASMRIRGAMIDQLRSSGWTPRAVSRQLRDLAGAIQRVENRLGREASGQEIAAEMGVSTDEYHQLLKDANTIQICSLEQVSNDEGEVFGDASETPEETFDKVASDNFQTTLASHIDQLPGKEKLVMSLYYDGGLNLKEIGAVLEVSESRVCQIHGQAILRLKQRLSDWISPQ